MAQHNDQDPSTARVETMVELNQPVSTVWQSLVDPERLARWMGEGSRIEPWPGGDLGVSDPVTGIPRRGRVETVTESEQLDAVWWPEDEPGDTSIVSFRLVPRPGGSTLTVVETVPLSAANRWDAMACARSAGAWRLAALAAVTEPSVGPALAPTPARRRLVAGCRR